MTKIHWQPGEQEYTAILMAGIRAERKKRRITQQELADYLGITRPHMVNLEAGRGAPSDWQVHKCYELFTEKDTQNRALQNAQNSRTVQAAR